MTGSIAEVWGWLIHVPALGILLLLVAGGFLAAMILHAWLEFSAGRKDAMR